MRLELCLGFGLVAVACLAAFGEEAQEVGVPAGQTGVVAATAAAVANGEGRDAAVVRAESELAVARAEIARLEKRVRELESANLREKHALHYNMGCVFRVARLFDRAEAEFLQALSINPSDPATHFNLGILYEEDLRRPAKAREHYRRFLELVPDDKDAERVREWMQRLGP
jgi:tetratricopeptide (TPR) repeat protein